MSWCEPARRRSRSAVNDLGATRWSGTTYRHVATRRDPLSGDGARRFGGRWNPRDSFNAIYLAEPAAFCAGELDRLAPAQGLTVTDLLAAGRTFHNIKVSDLAVLDRREDTGVGLVLTAFESRLRPGQLTVQSSETFTDELYADLSARA